MNNSKRISGSKSDGFNYQNGNTDGDGVSDGNTFSDGRHSLNRLTTNSISKEPFFSKTTSNA